MITILAINLFTIFIYGLFFCTQIYLISYNITTVEKKLYTEDIAESSYYSPNKYKNFTSIFGLGPKWQWLYPSFIETNKNNGYEYVLNRNKENLPIHTPTEEKTHTRTQTQTQTHDESRQNNDFLYDKLGIGDISRSFNGTPQAKDLIIEVKKTSNKK